MRKQFDAGIKTEVVLALLTKAKSLTELTQEYGVQPNQIYQWRLKLLANAPTLFERDRQAAEVQKKNDKEVSHLTEVVGCLTTQLSWLKKNMASNLTKESRWALVDRHDNLSLTLECALLSLNRTSLYYHPVPVSEEEAQIKHRIDEIHTEHPDYGTRRVTAMLAGDEGFEINRKRVQRYMRDMGIAGLQGRPL
jgi:putative transposase